jgi:hypothetical protein
MRRVRLSIKLLPVLEHETDILHDILLDEVPVAGDTLWLKHFNINWIAKITYRHFCLGDLQMDGMKCVDFRDSTIIAYGEASPQCMELPLSFVHDNPGRFAIFESAASAGAFSVYALDKVTGLWHVEDRHLKKFAVVHHSWVPNNKILKETPRGQK